MRAIVVQHRNEPGTLQDLPTPEPEAGEVLVRVAVAGINPVDWKARDVYEHPLPFVLGQDFAGTVAAVGEGVRRYAHGDRIFGIAKEHGAYAEYTIVPEDNAQQPVAKIPDDIGDADAAALPTAGLTALACVERMDVAAGQVLFIVGVTGAVGQFAAQIALGRGARVAGSGSSANASVAADLGLEFFVAYDSDDVAAAVRAKYPDGVEALLDLADDADGVKRMEQLVRRGGIVASTIRSIDEADATALGIRGLNVNLNESPQSSHDGLRRLAALVEQGTVKPPIVAERNLSDALQALELQKSGKATGKILITV
jgi:NADPH:quinone reductase-like Zn-dependent oxidoreductase